MEKDTVKLEANTMLLQSRGFMIFTLNDVSGLEEYLCDMNKCKSQSEKRGFYNTVKDCLDQIYKDEFEEEEKEEDETED